MKTLPWPDDAAQPLLFILDAAHHFDEKLLRQWLDDTWPEGVAKENVTTAVIPICRDPENIPSGMLLPALEVSDNTLVVPLRVVWKRSQDAKDNSPRCRDLLRGNPSRPGPIKAKRRHQRYPERTGLIAAQPATLGQMRAKYHSRRAAHAKPQQLADYVAGQAGLALDIAERRLRGSRYKVARRVASHLQARPRFKQALAAIGAQTGRTAEDLQAESNNIMKELIAVPQTFWLDVAAAMNRRIINLGYESAPVVDDASLEKVRQITREYPTALLWTHKTHVDGFAIQSLFMENDFPAPHILGGVNMAFGGLGYMARRAGAIFIRRSFQDNPVYKMILRQYIGYLMEKRFPLTWAFEGTRSRVGKLMPPRYGILKYVVEAAHTNESENLHIIPMAINYDLIGDVGDYASEQAGATKRPESLSWFIGYLRGLRQPLGRIYVDIGEPVILPEAPPPEDYLALQKIAFQVGVQVNKVTPITLTSLSAMILLGAAPRALTREEFRAEIHAHIEWAQQRGIRFTSSANLDNDSQMSELADALVNHGLLTRYDEGPEMVYAIKTEQHSAASYYRNTTVHHFVNKAISEIALMAVAAKPDGGSALFWQEADRIRDLFKFEFFYAPIEAFRNDVNVELSRYREDWEAQLDRDPAFVQSFLPSFTPLVAHGCLLSFVDAYKVVADILARKSADAALDSKKIVNECLAYGRQAYMQRRIASEASIAKLLFENGFTFMDKAGLVEAGDEMLVKRRAEMSQSLREVSHWIDVIRTIGLAP